MVCQEVSRALRNQSKFNSLSCEQNKTMNLKTLKIFSQNVWKNKLFTNTILENNKNFDILFIQELFWLVIHSILSSISEEEVIIEAPHHPLWIMFIRSLIGNNNDSRVITYINIRFIKLCFSLRKNILNHHDINLTSFLICLH